MNTPPRVAIVGTGAEAWLAGLALSRAFRHRDIQVVIAETGPGDAPLGYWTLPSQRNIHGLLKISEPDLVRKARATYRLGSEHRNWQGDGSRFLYVHGELGTELGGAAFYQFLLREALAGRGQDANSYSLAASAARLGRFARPMGDGQSLTSSFTYGYHIDAAGYAALLREAGQRAGLRCVQAGTPVATLREDGSIGSLKLPSGEELVADLYIDCTGSAALLLAQLSSNAREDWSGYLPCDRQITARAPALTDPPALTRTVATDAGWSWHMPLFDSSLIGEVYSSAFQTEDDALARLRQRAPDLAALSSRRMSSGRRSRFWERNCLALGAAALELEPLAGASLHFAELGIVTLIELFPLDSGSTIEAAEYDRVMGEYADALRDFTLAHYHVGRSPPGEFWKAVRNARLPDRLAHKLDLYAANGRIELLDFESFEEGDWAWLFIGSGALPDALELQILTLIEKLSANDFATLREQVRQLAASMPRHVDYVQRAYNATARGA